MESDKQEVEPIRSLTLAPRTFSLMPQSLGEAMSMAKMIAESDFAPKDYKNKPGNVLVAVQMGLDLGLRPMQALATIAVINGKPSVYGDGAPALCMAVLERFHETITGEGDNRMATCTVRRKGFPDDVVRTFSVKDAKLANLWGKAGPWSTYPDRMLQMRARGFALRDAAPDALMGLILAEEADDYPSTSVQDVTPGSTGTTNPALQMFERLPEALRDRIEKAFETMSLASGLRLAKINEYLGAGEGTDEERAEKLLNWARDEYAARKGRPRATSDNGKAVDPKVKGPDPVAVATESKGARVVDAEVVAEKTAAGPPVDEIFKAEGKTKQPPQDLGF